jgi:hypothetical protein
LGFWTSFTANNHCDTSVYNSCDPNLDKQNEQSKRLFSDKHTRDSLDSILVDVLPYDTQVKEAQQPTKCFFNGAVTCDPKFISSFNVLCRGQDAASEAHHSRNTHVVAHAIKNESFITITSDNDYSDIWTSQRTGMSRHGLKVFVVHSTI